MKFKLGTKVLGVKKEGSVVKVEVEAAKGGNKETVSLIVHFPIPTTYVPYELVANSGDGARDVIGSRGQPYTLLFVHTKSDGFVAITFRYGKQFL